MNYPSHSVVWLAKGCLNSTLLSLWLCYSFTCSTNKIAKYPGFPWTKTVTTMLLTVMKVQQWDWWGLSDKRWASEGLEPKGCALGKMCSAPRSVGKNTRTQATFSNQCSTFTYGRWCLVLSYIVNLFPACSHMAYSMQKIYGIWLTQNLSMVWALSREKTLNKTIEILFQQVQEWINPSKHFSEDNIEDETKPTGDALQSHSTFYLSRLRKSSHRLMWTWCEILQSTNSVPDKRQVSGQWLDKEGFLTQQMTYNDYKKLM